MMEKISWLVLGAITLVAAARAYSGSTQALRVGRMALGVLYLAAGALVNAIYLSTGDNYRTFADAAHIAFVRTTWQDLVVPNHTLFITLLILFEATVGVLVLVGGRAAVAGMAGALAMHIGLLAFGWVITIWSVIMLAAIGLLLTAQLQQLHAREPVAVPERLKVPA